MLLHSFNNFVFLFHIFVKIRTRGFDVVDFTKSKFLCEPLLERLVASFCVTFPLGKSFITSNLETSFALMLNYVFFISSPESNDTGFTLNWTF